MEMMSPKVTNASSSTLSVVVDGLRPAMKMVFLLTEVESGSMIVGAAIALEYEIDGYLELDDGDER